jgi:chemotaxis protein CheD
MIEPEVEQAEVYLQPGEMFLAREPTMIRTLLGSCVGVTFWSATLGIGALCHAMLPKCPKHSSGELSPEVGYRYVDYSIRDLARKFDELGARRSEVQVKLFGGADVLLGGPEVPDRPTVGSLNCDSAHDVLSTEGFQVTASSLRGTVGLNIHFDTGNGEVQLRRLMCCSVLILPRGQAKGRRT